MENLTFNDIPEFLTKIMAKLENIEKMLLEKGTDSKDSDHWLSISELCEYLPDKPTLPTVYGWVSKKIIPYYKSGSRLRFLKSEIDQWLKQGRRKTLSEIDAEAQAYLVNKKKR